MAKFKFYQDKEITTWVRDFFSVEAETLEEAIAYVKGMDETFEDNECREGSKVDFIDRDWDWMNDVLVDMCDQDHADRYIIMSCDLLDYGRDDYEVVSKL